MIEDKIEKLLKSGDKLSAIQVLVKEEYFSLKDAKDYVEQFQMEFKLNETATNQKDEPLKKQKEASWLFLLAVFAFVFLIIVFMTAPIICKNTEVLQGFTGLCFWLFLHGRVIFVTSIAWIFFLWKLIKTPRKAKIIGAFLATSLLLFIFVWADGEESMNAAKDILSEPIEVSFVDYEIENVYKITGRSGSSKICYRVVPEQNRGVTSILMPINAISNIPDRTPLHEPDIEAMRKAQGTITVFVYPNTGIVANNESLEMLSEYIIY